MSRKIVKYTVTFQPLSNSDTYQSTATDVSDNIELRGVKSVKRSIDAGDYDVGIFTYGDINIKAFNKNGLFNGPDDSRSMFPVTRDRCKVVVNFVEIVESTGVETAKISFRGLINEEATRVNPNRDEITFRVLSRDSIMRNTKVASGLITNGLDAKTAMVNILSQSKITKILTVDAANINPDLDITIDVGTKFDNKTVRKTMNDLLLVTNSSMIIDSSDTVIVKSRAAYTDKSVLNLYGKFDIHGRENMIDLSRYNSGLHRVFTSVVVNDVEKNSSVFSEDLGEKQKRITIDFVTDSGTEGDIATRLVKEFKYPKIELSVKIETKVAKDYGLLDRVAINYPLRVEPEAGNFLPIVGITKIDSATEPLPNNYGSLVISPNTAFKIIEITENPSSFESTLKLRQLGTEANDGFYNLEFNSVVNSAIVGESILQATVDSCETWNPSVVGAAQVNCTKVA